MNIDIVRGIAKAVQNKQTKGELRKESSSSLVTVLGVVALIATALIDVVPAEWTIFAAILSGIAAGVNFYITRFTVPAITDGQINRLEAEAAVQMNQVTAPEPSLPVHDIESTNGGSTVRPN